MRFAREWLLLLGVLLGVVESARADDKTLAERVPSVTQRVFEKRGRVEVLPEIGLSLSDAFYTHLISGVGVRYYFGETLAVGVFAEHYKSYATPPEIAAGGVRPTVNFNAPQTTAHAQILWAPIYGKLSLFGENVLHFDMYVSGGVGALMPKHGAAIADGVVAVGQHFVFNSWSAVQIELRDTIYSMARNAAVEPKASLQNALSASLALCFFIPTRAP